MEDPICGMEIDVNKTKYKALGKYFCSETCQKKYKGKFIEISLSLLLIAIAVFVYLNGYMLPFMGITFLILSSLKLIDIKGFSAMFKQYDLLAKKSSAYATIYPFIELSSGTEPPPLNIDPIPNLIISLSDLKNRLSICVI